MSTIEQKMNLIETAKTEFLLELAQHIIPTKLFSQPKKIVVNYNVNLYNDEFYYRDFDFIQFDSIRCQFEAKSFYSSGRDEIEVYRLEDEEGYCYDYVRIENDSYSLWAASILESLKRFHKFVLKEYHHSFDLVYEEGEFRIEIGEEQVENDW